MTTRPTPMPLPPWMAMLQAHADKAETDLAIRAASRDIANAAHDDVIGPRAQTHRKEQASA